MRPTIQINIPTLSVEYKAKGLCPICGKTKDKFEKYMRVYCSLECKWKYQDYFLTWGKLRSFILGRDDCKCVICGKLAQEVDHIIALINGGSMWDEANLRSLCHDCHKIKTKEDISIYAKEKKLIIKENIVPLDIETHKLASFTLKVLKEELYSKKDNCEFKYKKEHDYKASVIKSVDELIFKLDNLLAIEYKGEELEQIYYFK